MVSLELTVSELSVKEAGGNGDLMELNFYDFERRNKNKADKEPDVDEKMDSVCANSPANIGNSRTLTDSQSDEAMESPTIKNDTR